MLGRRLDTTECPRVPGQPGRGEGSSCSHAPPNPRSSNLKDGKKEGKRLHALQKVLQSGRVVGRRGCHVLCVLNLGCGCARLSLSACSYGNALRRASATCVRACAHRAALGAALPGVRSHSQHVCGFNRFAANQPQHGTSFRCLPGLVASESLG